MASNEPQPPGGWLVLPAPRLAPPAGRGPLFSPLSRLAKRFGRDRVPDVFRLLHHNASLFWGWLHFAS
ncbi:MAG: hypothetical protein L0H29_06730, partial [Sinobacteraceae bacterium]|nr:hypothetical protein [Nevskiaceae bacterium]